MQSTKKYTNLTFTKRVDKEKGAHRPPKAPRKAAVCERCGAQYDKGRWTLGQSVKARSSDAHWKPAESVVCPACKQIEEGIVGGYLYLSGAFYEKHASEIQNLLANEGQLSTLDNPLSKVIRSNWAADKAVLETTTEHLAQRLGHAVEKAYSGKVKYDFSHENKVARVYWHRD
jgi:hypothetical protein